MEDKSLADKAINLKGKQYVLVSDRVLYFNEKYPGGSIITEATYHPEARMWSVKATVKVPGEKWRHAHACPFDKWLRGVMAVDSDAPACQCGAVDTVRILTGHSQAVVGGTGANKDAALENAETSAVGRALAFMGIGVIESIASADEMHKATRQAPEASKQPVAAPKPAKPAPKLTQRQEAAKDRIRQCLGLLGEPNDTVPQVAEAVKRLTGLELQIANFEVIGEKLGKLVEDSVDPTK